MIAVDWAAPRKELSKQPLNEAVNATLQGTL